MESNLEMASKKAKKCNENEDWTPERRSSRIAKKRLSLVIHNAEKISPKSQLVAASKKPKKSTGTTTVATKQNSKSVSRRVVAVSSSLLDKERSPARPRQGSIIDARRHSGASNTPNPHRSKPKKSQRAATAAVQNPFSPAVESTQSPALQAPTSPLLFRKQHNPAGNKGVRQSVESPVELNPPNARVKHSATSSTIRLNGSSSTDKVVQSCLNELPSSVHRPNKLFAQNRTSSVIIQNAEKISPKSQLVAASNKRNQSTGTTAVATKQKSQTSSTSSSKSISRREVAVSSSLLDKESSPPKSLTVVRSHNQGSSDLQATNSNSSKALTDSVVPPSSDHPVTNLSHGASNYASDNTLGWNESFMRYINQDNLEETDFNIDDIDEYDWRLNISDEGERKEEDRREPMDGNRSVKNEIPALIPIIENPAYDSDCSIEVLQLDGIQPEKPLVPLPILENKKLTQKLSPPTGVMVEFVTAFTAELVWTAQNPSLSYRARHWPKGQPTLALECSSPSNNCRLMQLNAETTYSVVIMTISEDGSQNSASSEPVELTTMPENARFAEILKMQSKKIGKTDGLRFYSIPLTNLSVAGTAVERFVFGKADGMKPHRTVLLIGECGSGKSTLINSMINYICDVKWEDDFRFQLIQKRPSKMNRITVYEIHHSEGFRIPYSLTIINTPGFHGNRNLFADCDITEMIRQIVAAPGCFQQLDMIGFVTPSFYPRQMDIPMHIFNSLQSIFGVDCLKDNVHLLITFADGRKPPILDLINEAGMPYSNHHKFNNAGFFCSNQLLSNIYKLNNFVFWKENYFNFFNFLSSAKPFLSK